METSLTIIPERPLYSLPLHIEIADYLGGSQVIVIERVKRISEGDLDVYEWSVKDGLKTDTIQTTLLKV